MYPINSNEEYPYWYHSPILCNTTFSNYMDQSLSITVNLVHKEQQHISMMYVYIMYLILNAHWTILKKIQLYWVVPLNQVVFPNSLYSFRTDVRGIARNKLMYRHHYTRGVRGHPFGNFWYPISPQLHFRTF